MKFTLSLDPSHMDLKDTNNSHLDPSTLPAFWFSRSIRFALIISVNVPSSICSIFLIYHLLTKRDLRRALHNHAIVVLLFIILLIQFVDMPLHLNYFRLGFVRPRTPAMCLSWWYINYGFYGTTVIFLAWTSFERHIFVFHSQLIATPRKRWLFHYSPMIFFTLYPLAFYLVALLMPYCQRKYSFDYAEDLCRYYPCYYVDTVWNSYDILVNGIVPCLLVALFSIVLLLRIIWTKRVCLRGPMQWRKYRTMTIQILLISSIFVCFNLPLLIYSLVDICGSLPSNVNSDTGRYFLFLANFAVLCLPFVMLFSLPKQIWRAKWRKQFDNLRKHYRNRTLVHAHTL